MNKKIKNKYPGLKTQEDYDKLSKMLSYRKLYFYCGFIGIFLTCIFALLYAYMQQPIFCILIISAVLVTLVLDTVFINRIDEAFIAKAMLPSVVEQNTLNLATVLQKIQTKRVAKKKDSNTLFVGWSVFILAIVTYNYFKDSDYNWITPVLYLVIIPTSLKLLFGVLSKLLHDKKIKRITNGEYKVLKTKLAYKTISEIGGDTTSEYYYLHFVCKEFGEHSYKVSKNTYLCSNEHEDMYYLLIMPHKKGYDLIEIFPAKEWRCSDELKDIIEIDIDA